MQVIRHRFGIMSALLCSIVLAGCSDREVILPGKREPILTSEPSATDGAGALAAPKAFAMPTQKNNVAWPQGHASPSTQVVHAALSAAPKPLWALSVGTGDRARNRITADPIVAEGIVFTLDSLSVLTATSAAGRRLWSRDLTPTSERAGDADGGGIAYGDGVVFVSTGYGVLHALDPKSGSALWKQELKGSGNGRPSYFDGVVYLVSQDSVAWAIEAATGRIRWQLDHLNDVNNMSGSTGPAISEILEEFDLSLKTFQERGIPTLRFGGVEADDIAAYIVQKKKDFNINEIWLISSDKDWDLLIQEGVSRFSTVTRKETTLLNWDEHYEVDPEMYITYKCLTGDKGDNIPGIKGIGPKRATQLIEQYGDIYDIYNSCPIDSRYKFVEELNRNKEQLLLNVELMDLVTYSETALGKHTKVVDDIVGNYI